MKVEVKNLPQSMTELTVEVDVVELTPYLEHAAYRLSKEKSIPGFRPGRAPLAVVARLFGEQVILEEAVNEIIEKTYPEAVSRAEPPLPIIGPPKVEVVKLAAGNPFIYRALVSLLPKLTLGDYKKIKAKKQPVVVDEQTVEKNIATLRQMRAKEVLVDRPAKTGDKVEIDFDASIDSVPLEGASSRNHPLTIGSGNFIPGFEENLIDLERNQSKVFPLSFPNDYHQKNLAGRSADFKVTVKNVFEVELPEVNDEFAKSLGQESAAKLTEQIRENLKREQELKAEEQHEVAILKEIINRSTFTPLPPALIEAELNQMITEMKSALETDGLNFSDYLAHLKKTEADIRSEFTPRARERIQSGLIMREIIERENITVEAGELEDEWQRQREKYSQNPELLERINSSEFKDQLKSALLHRKFFKVIKKYVAES